ncbi:hypothetical protein [Cecembia calidifontis]|jgi:hypothetical protein|uniref:Uncharacterized protein n=1 Tax=Cecembia calidifontis TaxID=1187080 RepID=A0A4Q7P6L5_9BACT|nr:hypothetical protein [Cecembia calidifontis]RZS95736.1 hypothetical protein BC751_1276 [Cecembia calidifontis]
MKMETVTLEEVMVSYDLGDSSWPLADQNDVPHDAIPCYKPQF